MHSLGKGVDDVYLSLWIRHRGRRGLKRERMSKRSRTRSRSRRRIRDFAGEDLAACPRDGAR
jgi:hypothetical protein